MPGRGEIPKGKDAWPWAFLLIPSQRYRRPRKVKITGKPAVDCYQKSTSLNTADKQEIAKKSPAVSRSSSYGLVLRYKPLDPEFLFKRRLVPDEHDWYGNSLRKAWSTHKHSSSTMDHAFQEFQAFSITTRIFSSGIRTGQRALFLKMHPPVNPLSFPFKPAPFSLSLPLLELQSCSQTRAWKIRKEPEVMILYDSQAIGHKMKQKW